MLSKQLLSAAVGTRQSIASRRVKIVDATVLNCPGAKGEDYRLHLCFEAVGQSLCAAKLSDKRTAESLTHFEYQAGEIVLGDRIYAKARQIISVMKQGADVVVRRKFPTTPTVHGDGEKTRLEATVKRLASRRKIQCQRFC